MVASQAPDFFTADDARFAELVVRWVGMVAHRAELVGQIAHNAREQGRRAAAEELITVLAHDMRNLLWPLGARLRQSRSGPSGRAQGGRDRCRPTPRETVRRLAGLITNILDGARIDQGIFQLERRPLSLGTSAGR